MRSLLAVLLMATLGCRVVAFNGHLKSRHALLPAGLAVSEIHAVNKVENHVFIIEKKLGVRVRYPWCPRIVVVRHSESPVSVYPNERMSWQALSEKTPNVHRDLNEPVASVWMPDAGNGSTLYMYVPSNSSMLNRYAHARAHTICGRKDGHSATFRKVESFLKGQRVAVKHD